VLGALSRPTTLAARVVVVRTGAADPTGAALEDARDAGEDAGVLVTMTGNELCAVVPSGRAATYARGLAERVLLVGIGESVEQHRVRHSHEAAGHALARAATGAPVVSWERVVRGGVLGLLDPGKASAFANDLLAPLTEVPGLRLTLLTFLKHHGSRLKVAEELGIHRNTVRHRLGQVEELTGLNLDDPGDRVSAWVALQAQSADESAGARRLSARASRA
jgi:purine catabolism regulator